MLPRSCFSTSAAEAEAKAEADFERVVEFSFHIDNRRCVSGVHFMRGAALLHM